MRQPSLAEIEWLCDVYQRIADHRRIEWVNRRDDKHDRRLIIATIFAIILYFSGWVL